MWFSWFSILLLMILLFDVRVAEGLDETVESSATPGWRLMNSRRDLRMGRIRKESRYVLPVGRDRFDLTGVDKGMIRTGFAIADSAWQRGLKEVEFGIAIRSDKKIRASLRGRLTPEHAGQWRDLVLTVPPPTGRKMELRLGVEVLSGERPRPNEILWSPPVIIPKPVSSGKNVVLISIDTLRADHLGAYGYQRDTSPNIDRLAREGVLFKNAIASSSWTLPSHASMFTGLDPPHHGAILFRILGSRLDAGFDTLPELLWDRGYETAGFAGGGFVSSFCGFAQGFDRFQEQTEAVTGRDDYLMGSIGGALGWLRQGVQRPFFLFLHTYAVHTPYTPPQPDVSLFDGDYQGPYALQLTHDDLLALNVSGAISKLTPRTVDHLKALYDAEIRAMDRTLQTLFDHLKSTGLMKSTCVIITSDHGEEFEEHGNLFHNHAKLYDELLRIPLIVWCPSLFVGGRVIEEPVALVDVMPTVLAMADVPIPSGLDGRSLQAVLAHGAKPVETRTLSHVHRSVERAEEGSVVALRTSRYKLVRDTEKERAELFDLRADPGETRDVSGDNLRVVEALQQALDDGLKGMRTPRAVTELEPPDAATRERLRALGYEE